MIYPAAVHKKLSASTLEPVTPVDEDESESAVELIDYIEVTGSAVDRITWGASGDGALNPALDGDADGIYIWEGTIVRPSGALTALQLEPLSTAPGTAARSIWRSAVDGSVSWNANLLTSQLTFAYTSGADHMRFKLRFDARREAVAVRQMHAEVNFYRASGPVVILGLASAYWTNIIDNITAPRFVASVGSGQFDVGTNIAMYKQAVR